ncbi:unnamed protein product [Rhizoctonia solani]|uniref:Peptidase M43 pregnancy-associated plasma-A domain-containing protein n=1 Tax=Rhizoctonia solani TaxID=456999 RepID=A0A8H3A268_9AGAM|nr:unnamed protein product [Rhizoctonia solani]
MLVLSFIIAAVLAPVVSAMPTNATGNPRTCGAALSAADILAAEQYFDAHKPTSDMSTFATTIPVYWHVISEGPSPDQGNIPDSQIADSIQVLNQDYGGSGISFRLVKTDRVVNSAWFKTAPRSQQEAAMKRELRRGGASTLNVYSVGTIYATFPSSYASNPTNDGVVILYQTVPGGTAGPFNQGRTLTHEAGHWVGLYHTFEDHRGGRGSGCEGLGDYVTDTPSEYSAAFGCPTGRDTCSGGGLDPINNYMDYTDDSCMNQFTYGQINRLKQQMRVYRGVPFS